jgi:tryptophan synthase beta subunit
LPFKCDLQRYNTGAHKINHALGEALLAKKMAGAVQNLNPKP